MCPPPALAAPPARGELAAPARGSGSRLPRRAPDRPPGALSRRQRPRGAAHGPRLPQPPGAAPGGGCAVTPLTRSADLPASGLAAPRAPRVLYLFIHSLFSWAPPPAGSGGRGGHTVGVRAERPPSSRCFPDLLLLQPGSLAAFRCASVKRKQQILEALQNFHFCLFFVYFFLFFSENTGFFINPKQGDKQIDPLYPSPSSSFLHSKII